MQPPEAPLRRGRRSRSGAAARQHPTSAWRRRRWRSASLLPRDWNAFDYRAGFACTSLSLAMSLLVSFPGCAIFTILFTFITAFSIFIHFHRSRSWYSFLCFFFYISRHLHLSNWPSMAAAKTQTLLKNFWKDNRLMHRQCREVLDDAGRLASEFVESELGRFESEWWVKNKWGRILRKSTRTVRNPYTSLAICVLFDLMKPVWKTRSGCPAIGFEAQTSWNCGAGMRLRSGTICRTRRIATVPRLSMRSPRARSQVVRGRVHVDRSVQDSCDSSAIVALKAADPKQPIAAPPSLVRSWSSPSWPLRLSYRPVLKNSTEFD